MRVMFMSLGVFYNLNESSVHLDILKKFSEKHDVWLVCKNENKQTEFVDELGIHVLRVHTGELKKVGIVKKGINTILLEKQFTNAVKKYLSDVRFDLVLYTTPPITFASAVRYIKERDNAVTYLMLKDIFPQNAVDLGMMSTYGVKGILYKYFRNKEIELYKCSDYIGCMSQANCDYILNNNSYIEKSKVEVCPNTTVIRDMSCLDDERVTIRNKYNIPKDKKVFVYGGNLGKPQDIPFVIKCMKECKDMDGAFFLIVGTGTEFSTLNDYVVSSKQNNIKLMERLPKEDYDKMIGACDVGLIFLDHRFTIPNFPSRLLAYMSAKLPVLAVTDINTDVGEVICDGRFGWWCESNDCKAFKKKVEFIVNNSFNDYGENAYKYLNDNYSNDKAYNIICSHLDI